MSLEAKLMDEASMMDEASIKPPLQDGGNSDG
jgi:hypothetical protein